ncbi:MAG: diguanylate cyclase [Gemmatimonadetes bacterium]|nr:diguanylate cyclase [Gemmatimonadota bacterium]
MVTSRPVPVRALALSLASLGVPVIGVFAFSGSVQEDQGMLIWLTSLVPAFLLAYYRGLRGVALAVAGGMAVLVLTQVVVLVLGQSAPNWTLLLTIVSVYLGVCIALAVFAEILHRERRAAELLALVDGLTGLPNRRHAEITLDAQFAAAGRGRKLVVVLYDLDRFKQVNDRHGHQAGDTALVAFADILKRHTRRMDLSARFGGEEFISVLTDVDLEDALAFANAVREEIRAHEFEWGHLSVSAGASRYEEGMGTYEVLVAAADRALYAAKEGGRDRVVAAGPASSAAPVPPRSEPAGTTSPVPATGKEKTILLVDDDAEVLQTLSRRLQACGYQIETTDDPEEAIRRYTDDASAIDLLITDVMMPRMNGLVLVDRISKIVPHLRVIFLSGYLQHQVSWSGLPGAVVGFVAKPVGSDFVGVVREVLERALPADITPGAGVRQG